MAFWGNSDGAKHPGCIISRVAPHRKVFGEKLSTPTRRNHKTVKLKVISHDFRCPLDPCRDFVGCFEGTLDGILRTSTTLKGNKNNFTTVSGAFPWMHHKIISGWFDDILGNSYGKNHQGFIISYADDPYEDFRRKI